MRTGRLSISRGHELFGQPPAIRAEPRRDAASAPVSFVPATDKSELHLIDVRLKALERLTRLVEQGALSMEEFKLEKSLVLRLTTEEMHPVKPAPPPPHPGPSLLGRLVGWRFGMLALLASLGLSYAAQPDETAAFLSNATGFFVG